MSSQHGRAGEARLVRHSPRLQEAGVADTVRLPARHEGRGGGQEEAGGVRRIRGPVLQQQGGGHPQGHLQVRWHYLVFFPIITLYLIVLVLVDYFPWKLEKFSLNNHESRSATRTIFLLMFYIWSLSLTYSLLKNMSVLWSCMSDFFSRSIWIQLKSLVVSINQRRHSVIFYQSPHSPSGSFPEISSFLNILLNHIIFAPTLIIGKLNFESLEENPFSSPFNSRGRLKLLKCGRFKVDSRGATSKSCSTCNFNSGRTTFTDSLNNPSPRLL